MSWAGHYTCVPLPTKLTTLEGSETTVPVTGREVDVATTAFLLSKLRFLHCFETQFL